MNDNDLEVIGLNDFAEKLLKQFLVLHLRTGPTDRQRLLLDIARCPDAGLLVRWWDPPLAYCNELLVALIIDGRAALVRYLGALINPAGLGLGPDDRDPLVPVIEQIESLTDSQWVQAFPPSRYRTISADLLRPKPTSDEPDLDALRAADDRCGTGTPYPTLDHDKLLVGCDLKSPCEEFARHLGETPAAGIYTFATAGDQNLLARFVLPRLQGHLRDHPLRRENIVPHFFWAVPGVDEPVELRPERSRSGSPVPHWRDQFRLFAGDGGVDQIVVVWNAQLPADDIATFADGLQREFYPSLLPTIQRNNQLFFVIWADLEHETVVEHPCYWCLPLPDRLAPDEVRKHFDYHLRRQKVQEQDIACAIGLLDDHLQVTGAKAKSAFSKMQDIEDALKRGMI